MSVTREVTQRPGRPADAAAAALAEVEPLVLKEATWFGNLLPDASVGGLNVQMFTTRLIWMLRKSARGDGKLLEAAHNDPDSFVFAATECASYNLVPGEEYWFVPFKDKETGLHVTGMPGWKGEVQQILRSGAAVAVVKELVWRDARNHALSDGWKPWRPAEMIVPDHELNPDVPHTPDNVWMGYGFARLMTGGITHPIVLGQYEFDLARSHAKQTSFWGTDDKRGKWYARMCLKTICHRLYDEVPHSAGYVTQLLTAFQQAADRFPAIQMPQLPETEAGAGTGLVMPAALPGSVVGPPVPPDLPGVRQPARGGQPGDEEGTWPAGSRPAGGDEFRGILQRIGRQFTSCGAGWTPDTDEGRQRLLVITGVLAVPRGTPRLQLKSSSDLTLDQARLATELLAKLITGARDQGRDPAADLQKLYDAATGAGQPAAEADAGSPAGQDQDAAVRTAARAAETGLESAAAGNPEGGDADGGDMAEAAAELLGAVLAGIGVTDPGRVAEACSAYAHRAVDGPAGLTETQGSELLAVVQRCAEGEEPLILFTDNVEGWLADWARDDEETFTVFDSARRAA